MAESPPQLKQVESKESEEWPPQWKEFEYSPQARFGMIDRKLYDLNLEEVPDIGDLRKFLQQIRDSRGYDVDCHPPASETRYAYTFGFFAQYPEDWIINHTLLARVKYALNEINTQAQKHGERYELVDIVRVVELNGNRMGLLTFNVRQVTPNTGVVKTIQAMVFNHFHHFFELCEWRFRPGPPETAPENSLDMCSKGFPPFIPDGLTADTVMPSIFGQRT